MGRHRRQRREKECLPGADDIVIHAIGPPYVVNTYTEAAREGVEGISWLHNVYDPTEGRAAGIGPWSGAGVESGSQKRGQDG